MTTYVSKELQAGLDAVRTVNLKRSSRMMVEANGKAFRVLRFWDTGFALDMADAPNLRGFVDLYERGFHLYQCLIVASAEEGGQMIYEFKRLTAVHTKAPLDFVMDHPDVSGLLEERFL
ncbi:hypothetical protein SAMN06265173_11631 [Thalassovita litoralis]|jgi:hypothetical protein|uniref:Uncharacterized protein n=1 Tax=Thalassovita litoralis TaxID=1010611 RepID=A0A521EER0_9RHOB|nr:hypothetical protein [Thalassovita litoralis]SMO82409.1 hypothetical protein SAMN06265173_11631 [Thalassovita litoralis]